MLQGPSRGLCPAQTSGSPMTLFSAPAAGSASKADVNLECVETGQASGTARDVAPALEAPSNAISNPTSKREEDRPEAFDDVGFHAWCVDQASVFLVRWLARFSPWCLEYTVFLLLASHIAVSE